MSINLKSESESESDEDFNSVLTWYSPDIPFIYYEQQEFQFEYDPNGLGLEISKDAFGLWVSKVRFNSQADILGLCRNDAIVSVSAIDLRFHNQRDPYDAIQMLLTDVTKRLNLCQYPLIIRIHREIERPTPAPEFRMTSLLPPGIPGIPGIPNDWTLTAGHMSQQQLEQTQTSLQQKKIQQLQQLPRHVVIKFINEPCSICHDSLTEDTIRGSLCGHFYCVTCFSKIDKCSVCRSKN